MKMSKITLLTAIIIAMAFTVSCSGGGDGGGDEVAGGGSSSVALRDCDAVFNPASKFCYDGEIYDKCDGMDYNPTTHICTGDIATRAKCGNEDYNPLTQRCNCPNAVTTASSVTCDGQTYKTVKIGTQTWMAKNLNYNAEGSRCYNDEPSYCTKYGRLYDWETAMKACPAGWHLPSNEEWDTLIDYVESQGDCTKCAETRLKATSGWNEVKATNGWNEVYFDGNGTDNHDFSALPGGRGLGTSFYLAGNIGCWWSSSEYDSYNAYSWNIERGEYVSIRNNNGNKTTLLSVRCLQD